MAEIRTGDGDGGSRAVRSDICARLDEIRAWYRPSAGRSWRRSSRRCGERRPGRPAGRAPPTPAPLRGGGRVARVHPGRGHRRAPGGCGRAPGGGGVRLPGDRCDRRAPARNQPVPETCRLYGEPMRRRRLS